MEDPVSVGSSANLIYTYTAVVFATAMIWESLLPRRKLESHLAWRWLNNFSLGAISWYVSAVVGTWFILWLSQLTRFNDWGLLRQVDAGPVLGFFALLTLTQFFNYWVHRAFHRFSWLWPLHAVHHSDVDVDVSTSYRHHPLEPLVSLPVVAPAVLLLGVSMEATAAYRIFEVSATVLSHSNVRIPRGMERYLRRFILTPDFHRLHHCSEPRYTNSNYGSLVPWFDYLFGTARTRAFDDQESMELGLEYLRQPRDSRLDQLLMSPVLVPGAIAKRAESGDSEAGGVASLSRTDSS